MAIQLQKVTKNDGGVKLKKGFQKVKMTCQWDSDADVDIQAFVLKDGRAEKDTDFVYYYNQDYVNQNGDVAVHHLGDARTGRGDGDDETIMVDLTKLEPQKNEVLFTISINNAVEKGQHLGNIGRLICTLYDATTDIPIAQYNVEEDMFGEIAGKLCRVVKINGDTKFEAVGEGADDLASMVEEVGIQIAD